MRLSDEPIVAPKVENDMAYTSKTNEDAFARVEALYPGLRRNKDGQINGNALHSLEMGARHTFHRNGADWNTACTMSRELMRRLKAGKEVAQ